MALTTKELDNLYSTLNAIELDLQAHVRHIQRIKAQITKEILGRKQS